MFSYCSNEFIRDNVLRTRISMPPNEKLFPLRYKPRLHDTLIRILIRIPCKRHGRDYDPDLLIHLTQVD